jgi:hypothetical protein
MYGMLPSYRAMLDREGVDGPAELAVVGSADEVAERVYRGLEPVLPPPPAGSAEPVAEESPGRAGVVP